MMLGRIYYSPLGNVTKDLAKAREHFVRAADEGLGRAFTMLGRMALEGHGGSAAEYFRTAGERGDPEGWYRLSELYRHGETVEPDPKEADRLLKLAANRGHVGAREMLGMEAQAS
ncbi:MAG: tetratricopeptide repeat protein [Rhizobiaceae bacterium]